MFRVLTAVGVSAQLCIGVSAQAAPAARACQVLTDPSGDALVGAPGSLEAAPELDLRSGSISVDRGTLTVTIRITRTEAAMPTTGEDWRFVMSDKERSIDLAATRGPDGVAFAAYGGSSGNSTGYASNYPYIGPISGRLDLPSGLITMTAPLTQLGLRPTSMFSRFRLESGQGVATSGEAVSGPLSPTGQSLNQSTTTGADSAQRDVRQPLNKRC